MIGTARRLFDRWRGAGANAATVPPMDGVLGPNQAIEEAPMLLSADAPDNLVSDGRSILFSTHARIMRLAPEGPGASEVASFDAPVSALAAAEGAIAVGLELGGILIKGGRHDGKAIADLAGRRALCVTAILFADADTLLVALGSQQNAPSAWRHDLMQKNAGGSVWRVDLASCDASCLADELAWPAGLLADGDGVIVSESWRNRLLRLQPGRRPSIALADIPGYPGRLAPGSDGAWLSVFAPRSQLVEFVLREDDYRKSMLAEVDPGFWIAPSLSATQSFLEPMQLGGLKQLGILKPWAPTRSFGLIIGLDEDQQPRTSFHSRADGKRHGMTSALEIDSRLVASSKGGDAIVAIPLDAAEATP